MLQKEALQILKTGANVFLTGAPGAGKTHVLNQYIDYLKEHRISVAVTASTGIAATHVGGVTIHSWAGIGINKTMDQKSLTELVDKKYLHKRFKNTKVLVIDEISMLDAETLDLLNKVCRQFTKDSRPFGGLQIVFVGDFFQLPPVSRDKSAKFAFLSDAWKELSPLICYIGEQHRQEDEELLSLLSMIRQGDGHENSEMLRERMDIDFEDVVVSTKLYTHNIDVDNINSQELAKLDSKVEVYTMDTKGPATHAQKLVDSCLSPQTLALKKGARVMCTKNNFEKGYVNGSLGEVTGFDEKFGYPIVTMNDGRDIIMEPTTWAIQDGEKTLAEVTQVPLRLAWAITVHKSQGMSLDAAEIDLGKAFEYGQGYVALSRVRTLQGIKLLGFNPDALMIHPLVLEEDKKLRSRSMKIKEYLGKRTEKELEDSMKTFIENCAGSLDKIDWRAEEALEEKIPSHHKTRSLIDEGKKLDDIAKERELTKETVLTHIEKLLDDGSIVVEDIMYLKPRSKKFFEALKAFQEVYDETGETHLSPVKNKTKNTSYYEIQLARLFLDK
ncbi:AAA family ATPase [Candidatus Parcubacteria bacterium]|nr:AAA family ATPase [Candidatus Parcubacteria bacterium]